MAALFSGSRERKRTRESKPKTSNSSGPSSPINTRPVNSSALDECLLGAGKTSRRAEIDLGLVSFKLDQIVAAKVFGHGAVQFAGGLQFCKGRYDRSEQLIIHGHGRQIRTQLAAAVELIDAEGGESQCTVGQGIEKVSGIDRAAARLGNEQADCPAGGRNCSRVGRR